MKRLRGKIPSSAEHVPSFALNECFAVIHVKYLAEALGLNGSFFLDTSVKMESSSSFFFDSPLHPPLPSI